VYEEEAIYRGQDGSDVSLMTPGEVARMELKEDQRVTVSNEVGQMHNIRVRPFEIAAGCALMYYPEANALVTTAVKSAVARVAPSSISVGPKVELTISGEKGRRERAALKAC